MFGAFTYNCFLGDAALYCAKHVPEEYKDNTIVPWEVQEGDCCDTCGEELS